MTFVGTVRASIASLCLVSRWGAPPASLTPRLSLKCTTKKFRFHVRQLSTKSDQPRRPQNLDDCTMKQMLVRSNGSRVYNGSI